MASLALIVGLIFLTVLLSGPLVLIISYCKFIPTIIVEIFSLLVILLGLWWIFTLTTSIGFIGLIPIVCGIKAISHRRQTLQI